MRQRQLLCHGIRDTRVNGGFLEVSQFKILNLEIGSAWWFKMKSIRGGIILPVQHGTAFVLGFETDPTGRIAAARDDDQTPIVARIQAIFDNDGVAGIDQVRSPLDRLKRSCAIGSR